MFSCLFISESEEHSASQHPLKQGHLPQPVLRADYGHVCGFASAHLPRSGIQGDQLPRPAGPDGTGEVGSEGDHQSAESIRRVHPQRVQKSQTDAVVS